MHNELIVARLASQHHQALLREAEVYRQPLSRATNPGTRLELGLNGLSRAVRLALPAALATTLGLHSPSAAAAHHEPKCEVIYNNGSGEEVDHDDHAPTWHQAGQAGPVEGRDL